MGWEQVVFSSELWIVLELHLRLKGRSANGRESVGLLQGLALFVLVVHRNILETSAAGVFFGGAAQDLIAHGHDVINKHGAWFSPVFNP